MLDGILDQIGQRPFQGSLIASHVDRFRRGFERQFVAGSNCQGSKVGHHHSPDSNDIDVGLWIDLLVDALKIQKLIGQGGQASDVFKHAPASGPSERDSSRV